MTSPDTRIMLPAGASEASQPIEIRVMHPSMKEAALALEAMNRSYSVSLGTFASPRHPEYNADGVFAHAEGPVLVLGVADGVGIGGANSADAANKVVQRMSDGPYVQVTDIDTSDCSAFYKSEYYAKQFLKQAVHKARLDVCQLQAEAGGDQNIDTTFCGGVIIPDAKNPDQKKLVWVNYGDSRCYIFSDGVLTQVSADDNYARLGPQFAHVLSDSIANLRQKSFQPKAENLKKGDIVIFMTDGISDNFPTHMHMQEFIARLKNGQVEKDEKLARSIFDLHQPEEVSSLPIAQKITEGLLSVAKSIMNRTKDGEYAKKGKKDDASLVVVEIV